MKNYKNNILLKEFFLTEWATPQTRFNNKKLIKNLYLENLSKVLSH